MSGVSQIVYPIKELTFQPDGVTANSVAYLPGQYVRQSLEWTLYFVFGTGVTAGVYKVESSWSPDEAATWPAEATVTFTGTAPNMQVVHLTALNESLRVRISTTVANGTPHVYAMAASRTS